MLQTQALAGMSGETSVLARHRLTIALASAVITIGGILAVNPSSIDNFVWYFLFWNVAFVFLNREDSAEFALAFLVNSAFIALYVGVQSFGFPDSYGTTAYQSVTWTDDSYFFSLTADHVPPDLLTRPYYWQYSHAFATLIKSVSPLEILHPLDVLFFQSGTAALLATSTRRLTLQLSGNPKLANLVFLFLVVCPFLMMNGGVILIRDTLAAALLAYSLYAINSRHYARAVLAIGLQLVLRPGTGLLLLPAYGVLYFDEVRAIVRRYPLLVAGGAVGAVLLAMQLGPLVIEQFESSYGEVKIGFLGRELIADLTADPDANAIFLTIQEFPFGIRVFLNAAYIFLYPFLTLRTLGDTESLDLRNIAMSVVVPIYSFWLNAWFVAGVLSPIRILDRQRQIVGAIVMTLVLVGTYSLQTRHKTIIYPLYYMIVAAGFSAATPFARRCGYIFSGLLLLVQIASLFR
jgi:hypothetical protein